MKKIVLIGLMVAVMFLGIGCASYSPRTGIPDVKTFQETGIKAVNAEAGITIVAYPIQTKEDADVYFDSKSLANDGLLPVYVNISISDIGKNYRIDAVYLRVENRNIPTISAETVYELIKKSYAGKMAFWGSWTYFVGAPISAAHTASVNKKIKDDLKEKEAKEIIGEIKKKEVSGFLYFKIPDNLESLDNSFSVFVLADKDNKSLTFNLPLKGAITAR